MPPLKIIAAGWVLIALDITVGRVDVLPDLLGWSIVVLGLAKIRHHSAALSNATMVSVAGLVVSLVLTTGAIVQPAADSSLGWVIVILAALLEIASVVLTLTGLTEVSRAHGDASAADRLTLVRTTVVAALGLTVAGLLIAPGILMIGLLLNLVVLAWFIVELVRHADRPWVQLATH